MKRVRCAFTILELLIVIGIVAILGVLSVPIYAKLRGRAQRAQCTANLRNLYVAADLYLQGNGSWPQIRRDVSESGQTAHATAWIHALEPFNVSAKTWICPTIENLLGNPDYLQAERARIDYMPMPFDDKPITPHQWPRQPWFIESGNVHGGGNLIIFTDGSISDLNTVVEGARRR